MQNETKQKYDLFRNEFLCPPPDFLSIFHARYKSSNSSSGVFLFVLFCFVPFFFFLFFTSSLV